MNEKLLSFLLSLPPSLQPPAGDAINDNPMIREIKGEYLKKKEELEGLFPLCLCIFTTVEGGGNSGVLFTVWLY